MRYGDTTAYCNDLITVTYQGSDFHACLTGHPEIWGRGRNPDEAIGSVFRVHTDRMFEEIRKLRAKFVLVTANNPGLVQGKRQEFDSFEAAKHAVRGKPAFSFLTEETDRATGTYLNGGDVMYFAITLQKA